MQRIDVLWALANGAASAEIDGFIRQHLRWPVGEPSRTPDCFRVIHLGWEVQSIVRNDSNGRRWKVVLTNNWPLPAEEQYQRLLQENPIIPTNSLLEFSAPGKEPWAAICGAALGTQGWRF